MANNLKAALDWAEAGFYVFPCIPGGKAPMHAGGHKNATTDAGQIRKWWKECPEANIGASPHASGHFVIDIDDKGNKHGSESFAAVIKSHPEGLPNTLTVGTPTGGRHLWFAGHAPSSVERICGGVDVRGAGGYVLLTGSSVQGRQYTTLRADIISEAPVWLRDATKCPDRNRERSVSEELDTPANISRAIHYLAGLVAEGDVAIEGSGGNETTYRVAAMLHDFGISEEKAVELLLEHWNDECSPPWTESELTDETHSPIYHAFEYSQNEAGSKGVRDNQANFSGITRNGQPIASAVRETSDYGRFRLRDEREQDTRPPPEWIVPGWIQEASTVMLYGPPGSYKSFVALDCALALASGRKALGLDTINNRGEVIYCAGEGAIGIEKLRRPAWRKHRRLAEGQQIPFYSVSDVPSAGEDPSEVDELIQEIDKTGIKPKLIVFDTLSRMLAGLDENSAKDASLAVKRIEEIKRHFNCVVMVVHHSGKDGKSERGSSAFRGGFDTLISCDRADSAVNLTLVKQKDAEDGITHAMKAVKVGGSLALSPHVVKETLHTDEDKPDDRRRERNILMTVLRDGGHTNRGNGLSTKALAQGYLHEAGEEFSDAGEEQAAVKTKESALNRKAKGVLKSYVVSDPGDTPIVWGVAS